MGIAKAIAAGFLVDRLWREGPNGTTLMDPGVRTACIAAMVEGRDDDLLNLMAVETGVEIPPEVRDHALKLHAAAKGN